MKRFSLIVTCLFLTLSSQAWSAGYGPAKSRLDAGQIYLGAGYNWLSEKYDSGSFSDDDLESDQNQVYAQAGVGLPAGWEIYVRGGVADYELDDPYVFLDSGETSDDLRPFVGLGIGGPIFRGNTLTIGPFAQVSYFSDYETSKRGGFSTPQGVINGKEEIFFDNALNIDLGFTFEVSIEGALLYGGPVYSYYDSSIESTFVSDSGLRSSRDEDVSLDAPFGVFVGISWPLGNNLHLDLEGQFRSGANLTSKLLYQF
ncbi:MAG: hypothetical protein RQ723_10815 [Desulfuromonadales bacterium]|nr:hypothetical protein [Desulfuromonadales bacterium]